MRPDSTLKILLLIIAIFPGIIALRRLFAPHAVQAQGADLYPFFIEPGYTTLRAPDGSTDTPDLAPDLPGQVRFHADPLAGVSTMAEGGRVRDQR